MNTYYCIIAQHISAHLTEFESRHHDNLWQFVTNVTAEMLVTHSINYFSVNPHLAQKNDLVDVWNTLYITWDFKVACALQEAVWLPDVPIRSHMQRLLGTHYFKGSETRRRRGVEGDWSKGAATRCWGGRGRRRGEAGAGRLPTMRGGVLLTRRELWKAPVWGLTREQSKDCSPKFVGLIY